MINSKKRLEEILNEIGYGIPFAKNDDNIDITGKSLAITKILKEFVHKDNLPNFTEIDKELYLLFNLDADLRQEISKTIRKLIEGKK